MASLTVAASGAALPIDRDHVRKLEDTRSDLVDDFVNAHPEGRKGWQLGVGIPAAVLGLAAGIGITVLSVRGRSPLYQSMTMMFMAPIAGAAGAAALGLTAAGIASVVTRPSGAGGEAQVAARRAGIRSEIDTIDTELKQLDGRRPGQLPEPANLDPRGPSILGTAKHLGTGFGLGFVGTAVGMGALGFGEFSTKPPTLAMLLGPAAAAALTVSAVGFLNQRDEQAGTTTGANVLRSAAIGGALFAATSLLPGFSQIAVSPLVRVGAAAGIGALVGVVSHAVTASSSD